MLEKLEEAKRAILLGLEATLYLKCEAHPLFSQSLLELADDKAPHAGAVRSLIERELQASWEQCEALLRSTSRSDAS